MLMPPVVGYGYFLESPNNSPVCLSRPGRLNLTAFRGIIELYNLIKSVFNTKFESKSTQSYRFQNRSGELNYIFLKVCFILNGLNKSCLHPELMELQTN